jgi:hypothetical protein
MKPTVIVEDDRGAEVKVERNHGAITKIDIMPSKNDKPDNAKIIFHPPYLKQDVYGYISTADPIFPEIQAAFDSQTEVDLRFEVQRKRNVDAATPLKELNATTETTRIFAGINGHLSDEALTLPENDPVDDSEPRRQKPKQAGDSNESPTSVAPVSVENALAVLARVVEGKSFDTEVVAALTAQALLAGATEEQVHEVRSGKDRRTDARPAEQWQSFAAESPVWSAYNKDGRPNLGHLGVAAGVGAEKFVREQGKGRNLNPEEVRIFANLILAIADRVQEGAYGEGFRADRGASSHGTIRGLVYDVITADAPLPFGGDLNTVKGWVAAVGGQVRARFTAGLAIADNRQKFTEIYGDLVALRDGVPVNPNRGAVSEAPARPAAPAEPTEAELNERYPGRPQGVIPGTPGAGNSVQHHSQAELQEELNERTPGQSVELGAGTDARAAHITAPSAPVPTPAQTAAVEEDEPAPVKDVRDIPGVSVGLPAGFVAKPRVVRDEEEEQALIDSYVEDEPVLVEGVDDVDSDDVETLSADEADRFDLEEAGITAADLDAMAANGLSTDETRAELTALVESTRLPRAAYSKVNNLLEATFGPKYRESKNVPEEALELFVSYYASTGIPNFRTILDQS